MGKEIERKFLVTSDDWRGQAKGILYRQGYLSSVKERVVRIRIIGNKGFLTIKGLTVRTTRVEYEYEIPVQDAEFMLTNLCEKPIIEKHRYEISFRGLIWEIDEFHGENEGLILAELELDRWDQTIEKPEWIGKDVSDDPRYYNSNLINNPYSKW